MKRGDLVEVQEEGIRPWRGIYWTSKPTPKHGDFVSVLREGEEIVVHHSRVRVVEELHTGANK
jgi:hypothetical protein